jgi:flagellar motor protein MotB
MIDMLTSVLMIFLLIYFVQYYLSNENLEAAIAQQRRDQFNELFNREFRGEEDISLVPELNSLRITFGEGVLFKPREYQLESGAVEVSRGKRVLSKLARVFAAIDTSNSGQQTYNDIQIEGHTDETALNRLIYPRNNWELSTARALEVLKFLACEAEQRLDERVMSVNGYASNRPVSKKRRPEDLSKNRRIEIRIFFSGRDKVVAPSRNKEVGLCQTRN